jgi:hypothetical protein
VLEQDRGGDIWDWRRDDSGAPPVGVADGFDQVTELVLVYQVGPLGKGQLAVARLVAAEYPWVSSQER